jgi:hypothetical protein
VVMVFEVYSSHRRSPAYQAMSVLITDSPSLPAELSQFQSSVFPPAGSSRQFITPSTFHLIRLRSDPTVSYSDTQRTSASLWKLSGRRKQTQHFGNRV